MLKTVLVNLERPIKSAEVLDNYGSNVELSAAEQTALSKAEQKRLLDELEAQKRLYEDANRILEAVTSKLNQFCDELFAGHKDQIAGLSVEIARKVLMRKVEDGDYQIESIIKEVLINSPTQQDITIYLNPEDLEACRRAGGDEDFAGVKFAADATIKRAECRLQSPKGIIKSLIDEHLEQIEKTLKKTE